MSDLREELAKFLDNFAFVHTNPPLRRALFDRLPPFVQALQVEWAEKVSTERVDAAVKAERERCAKLVESEPDAADNYIDVPGHFAAAIREGTASSKQGGRE